MLGGVLELSPGNGTAPLFSSSPNSSQRSSPLARFPALLGPDLGTATTDPTDSVALGRKAVAALRLAPLSAAGVALTAPARHWAVAGFVGGLLVWGNDTRFNEMMNLYLLSRVIVGFVKRSGGKLLSGDRPVGSGMVVDGGMQLVSHPLGVVANDSGKIRDPEMMKLNCFGVEGWGEVREGTGGVGGERVGWWSWGEVVVMRVMGWDRQSPFHAAPL